MVDLNFRPAAARVDDRPHSSRRAAGGPPSCDDEVFLGAGVTYARIVRELPRRADPGPGVANAWGRRRSGPEGPSAGTSGRARRPATRSPCWPCTTPRSSWRPREGDAGRCLADAFLLGPKRDARAPDELILGARWRPIEGPGSFSKVGTRNAMVIAVASVCLLLDPGDAVGPRGARVGGADRRARPRGRGLRRPGPGRRRARGRTPPPASATTRPGSSASSSPRAATPIDDVRGIGGVPAPRGRGAGPTGARVGDRPARTAA